MSQRQRDEKAEKEEKREEKEEKSWDEKWRRDPINTATWAAIIIWAGLVFLVDNLGLVAGFRFWSTWGAIFAGAGIIVLIQVAYRVATPAYRQPVTGSLILGFVLLGIGLGSLFGWNVIFPLVLIAIGVAILVRGFLARR